jgi:predicted dehydrogenase
MNQPGEHVVGVGFVGAGAVVQGIHLPALAHLRGIIEPRVVMDAVAAQAEAIAIGVGARATTSFEDLLEDPSVDVVAICSPERFHADQVIAAMMAGKAAVFCEKPLAVTADEAERVAAVGAATGVPLVVGAMHSFDPAWTAALTTARTALTGPVTVRSSIVLPLNDRFEEWSTELRGVAPSPPMGELDSDGRAALMHLAVVGLAIHDLPLVREFMGPEPVRVTAAHLIRPFGYGITLQAGNIVAQLLAVIHGQWKPSWEFDVTSPSSAFHIDFTPSFVRAGSGVSTITTAGTTQVFNSVPANGYDMQWQTLAEIARGDRAHLPSLDGLVEDVRFAVSIADAAAELVRAQG